MSKNMYSSAVDSLIAYINDVKPYHCKLSEIVEEYQFFEKMTVNIDDRKHFTKTKIAGIWDNETYSNGISPPIVDLPFVTMSKSSKYWNSIKTIVNSQIDTQILGLQSAYYLHHNIGVRSVTKDGFAQIEGIDFHISHGAASLNVDGLNKTVISSDIADIPSKKKETTSLQYDDIIIYGGFDPVTNDRIAVFNVTNIIPNEDLNVYEEYEIKCVRLNTTNAGAVFSVIGSESGLIGYAKSSVTFNSSKISFLLEALNNDFVFSIGNTFKLTPKSFITTHKDYTNSETWSIIKVNPIVFDRPRFIKHGAPVISKFEILNDLIAEQNVTLTFNGSSFDIVSSLDGNLGVLSFNTEFVSPDFICIITSGTYSPIIGDFFEIKISNIAPSIEGLDFTVGYDISLLTDDATPDADGIAFARAYEVFEYDDRFLDLDLSSLNLQIESGSINTSYFELLYNGETFSLTQFNNKDTRNIISTSSNIAIGESFNNGEISFTIPDNVEYLPNDMFVFDVVNPLPSINEDSDIRSQHFGKIVLYPKSMIDSPANKWKIVIGENHTFVVTNIADLTEYVGTVGKSFDNGFLHFTLINSNLSPFISGDTFTVKINEVKPSFLVFGSNSGMSKPLTVGKWFWNGKIGLKIDLPAIEIAGFAETTDILSFDGLNPPGPISNQLTRNLISLEETSSKQVILDSLGRTITFNRLPRFDANDDVYELSLVSTSDKFKLSSDDQFFNVTSGRSGIRKSAKVNHRYIDDTRPEQSFGVINGRHDGIVDFTISNILATGEKSLFTEFDRFNNAQKPIWESEKPLKAYNNPTVINVDDFKTAAFPTGLDNPEYIEIIQQFNNDLADFTYYNEYCLSLQEFYKTQSLLPKFSFRVKTNTPKLYHANDLIIFPETLGDSVVQTEYETTDKIFLKTSSKRSELGIDPNNIKDQWIPTYVIPEAPFSDESKSFKLMSSVLNTEIGTISCNDIEGSRFKLTVNTDFFNEYLPFNTRLNTKIIQNEQENLIVKARISEHINFIDLIKINDVCNVNVVDAHPAYDPLKNIWYSKPDYSFILTTVHDPKFYDHVNVEIFDNNYRGFFSGYDTTPYDNVAIIEEDPSAPQTGPVIAIGPGSYIDAQAYDGLGPLDAFNWNTVDVTDGLPIVDEFDWTNANMNLEYSVYGADPYVFQPYGYDVNLPIQLDNFGTVAGGSPYFNVFDPDDSYLPPNLRRVLRIEKSNDTGFGGSGYWIRDKLQSNTTNSKFAESVCLYSRFTAAPEYLDPQAIDNEPSLDAEGWNNADVTDGLPILDAEGWTNANMNLTYGLVDYSIIDNAFDLTVSISSVSIPPIGSELFGTDFTNVSCSLINVNRITAIATIMKHGVNISSISMYSNLATMTQIPITITENNSDFIKIEILTPSIGKLVVY